MTRTIEPTAQALEAFQSADDESPVVMLNLLRYRDDASYPADFAAEPCSGREAYGRYGEQVAPLIFGTGGKVLFMGQAQAAVIAPEGESWDDVILVQYPSRRAFIEMVTSAPYLVAAPHRTAALLDSRLIPMRSPTSDGVD